MAKRRTRTSARTKLMIAAAKAVRAEKLNFEREASAILSDALGFEVTVKIKRQRLGEGMPPAHRRAARKSEKQVRDEIGDQLKRIERFRLDPPDDSGHL